MNAKTATDELAEEPTNAEPGVTFEQISVRAYEIHISGAGGDEVENWLRAERELLEQLDADEERDSRRGVDEEN